MVTVALSYIPFLAATRCAMTRPTRPTDRPSYPLSYSDSPLLDCSQNDLGGG